MKRRSFLKYSGLATSSMLIPGFLRAFIPDGQTFEGKRLIIIQLSGGLDGLSAAIPYQNDIYYRSRPKLSVPSDQLLHLDDDMAFHQSMTGLYDLYQQGEISLINQVGYPNANRSHFRSMDIWQTASPSNKNWSSGWLGRYLDHECSDSCEAHMALEIDQSLSLAMKGERYHALALKDVKRLRETVESGRVRQLTELEYDKGNASLAFLHKTLAATTASTSYLSEQLDVRSSTTNYPNSEFGRQLQLIGSLVRAGANSRVYYSSLSGFDTHAGQHYKLPNLLTQFSEGVAALVKDLKACGQFKNSMIMVFSEFGRRLAENGSMGTDHGAANNVYLIGDRLARPGVYNGPTELHQLDDGDVMYRIDFRQIYAELLDRWLDTDHSAILRSTFEQTALIS